MDAIERIPCATQEHKRLLRQAAERYKRAVRMRADAVQSGDSLALTAVTGEFKNALKWLLDLGYPLDEVNRLYAEAVAETREGE